MKEVTVEVTDDDLVFFARYFDARIGQLENLVRVLLVSIALALVLYVVFSTILELVRK